ncbi:hypothetical protein [Flavobacterium sp. TAB 87]|uniref:hypothetical protein n=1 Tax=Flavobacterium sp. TAB 87 TaxID=1729581 RepID=UPI00076BF81C|nr:hypothetical protein [Flavobacterium sp. TAB 87]KVV14378.1 hypothetical protein AP058_02270 [Flavobacterium sp. TAB 87]
MDKTIQLRVKKDIDNQKELKVRKFKGTLITKDFTEIVHISDENEEFYLNFFSVLPEHKKQIENYVLDYISTNNLNETISIISNS